jgi:hypothetical protein
VNTSRFSDDCGYAQPTSGRLSTRRRMEAALLTSSRYELAFWEIAWRRERWPV